MPMEDEGADHHCAAFVHAMAADDDNDLVWLSDWGSNSLTLFDPTSEGFQVFVLPSSSANVRQLLGRPGELWGTESGVDRLVVVRAQ
jgi:virginiamycin B lyase